MLEKVLSQQSAVFKIEYFPNFKAWCAAVGYVNLYKKAKWSKYKESASKLEKANKTHCTVPLYLEVSTSGFSKYYGISIGQASKLKKLACEAGYIKVRKNFKRLGIPVSSKNLFKANVDPHVARRVSEINQELVLQQSDTIFPLIALSKRGKRKKWKT